MSALPPHPGMSGLAARDDAASAKPARSVPERRPEFLDFLGRDVLLRTSATPAEITRATTTSADITRAADDDADHKRSDFTRAPRPVCGCCGPQQCCCKCHQEER